MALDGGIHPLELQWLLKVVFMLINPHYAVQLLWFCTVFFMLFNLGEKKITGVHKYPQMLRGV